MSCLVYGFVVVEITPSFQGKNFKGMQYRYLLSTYAGVRTDNKGLKYVSFIGIEVMVLLLVASISRKPALRDERLGGVKVGHVVIRRVLGKGHTGLGDTL